MPPFHERAQALGRCASRGRVEHGLTQLLFSKRRAQAHERAEPGCVNNGLCAPAPAPSSGVPGPRLRPVLTKRNSRRERCPQGAHAGRSRTSPVAPGVSAARAASAASSALSPLSRLLVLDARGGEDAIATSWRRKCNCAGTSEVWGPLVPAPQFSHTTRPPRERRVKQAPAPERVTRRRSRPVLSGRLCIQWQSLQPGLPLPSPAS